ncbi:MAG TPA: hypothetical protein VFC96_04875 [Anaerovoracaceae bacterium]|nr:hypothetical protein [Anaerovoracaceae bacterium]
MKLYNCESPKETKLKETELLCLDDLDLEKLANEIFEEFREGELEDETIVVDALYQIIQEVLERLALQKLLKTRFINIGLDNIGLDKNGS